MSKKISRVAVITNFRIPAKRETALKAAEAAASAGAEVILPGSIRAFPEYAEYSGDKLPVFCSFDVLYSTCDLLIVVGGDGSILDAAKNLCGSASPVLGINMGRVGYMTELNPDEIGLIPSIIEGNYDVETRMMLEVSSGSAEDGCVYRALNDVVINNAKFSQVIDLTLSEGGRVAGRYRADGLILSTSTGSTAYTVAAGGPVIDPRLDCICATPVCPHTFFSKPTVFPPDSVLEVSFPDSRIEKALVTVDGKPAAKVGRNDTVTVRASSLRTSFVRVKPLRFYQTLLQNKE